MNFITACFGFVTLVKSGLFPSATSITIFKKSYPVEIWTKSEPIQSPPILAPISIIFTFPSGVILNSACDALFSIFKLFNPAITSFFTFSCISLLNPAGSVCPVSIKCGAPVVCFLVIVNIVCSPLYVIPSALNSSPSIYSSTIAFFSNDTSIASLIAVFNFSSSLKSSILVIDLLPDLSVGFIIIGVFISFILDKSLTSDISKNLGTDTPYFWNAFLISYLFVEILVHSKLFPASPNFSAK